MHDVDGELDELDRRSVAAYAGEAERAATFIGFGEAMPSVPTADGDQQVHDRLVARYIAPARAALGEPAWNRCTAAGAAMTPDELCEFVLDPLASVADRPLR